MEVRRECRFSPSSVRGGPGLWRVGLSAKPLGAVYDAGDSVLGTGLEGMIGEGGAEVVGEREAPPHWLMKERTAWRKQRSQWI